MMQNPGLNNAAILAISIGEDAATEVFKFLTPKEVQRLGEAISRLNSVSRDQMDRVLEKFAFSAATQGLMLGDTSSYVRSVLKRALGDEKATLVLDRISEGNDDSGIESLRWMDEVSIVELLRNEHPQIITAVMVHLEYELSAKVLMRFPERLRNEVLIRIAELEGIQPTALQDLNDVLYNALSGGEKMRKTNLGGVKSVAEIVNFMGAAMEHSVLENIRNEDQELAQQIVDTMFVFEDLLKLDNKGVQLALREISADKLVLALKGASGPLREKIFANLSTRAAAAMREDLDNMGPVRLSEVEIQQKEIIKTVRRLADEGQIALGGAASDSFV